MELSLDLSLLHVPKTVSEFLGEVSKIKEISQKLTKINGFVERLEEERRKIDAFKRELPLCMLLLNDAIGVLKEEAMRSTESSDGSVAEEFIPLKQSSHDDGGANKESVCSDKKNWMSSVQLWSPGNNCDEGQQQPVPSLKLRSEDDGRSGAEKPLQPCNFRNRGGAFVPFMGLSGSQDKDVTGLSLVAPISELGSRDLVSKTNISCRVDLSSSVCTDQNQVKFFSKSQRQQQQHQQQQQNTRKQRRCWSPELHRRFIEALQQLGGSQAATPKQIRELMQVDGLTNDEVKSHLQKYRLHIRRVPSSSGAAANSLWMPENICGDNSKPSISQSGSPQGPLPANDSAKGISSTAGDSMEAEEDEKSDGHSWKGRTHRAEEVHV